MEEGKFTYSSVKGVKEGGGEEEGGPAIPLLMQNKPPPVESSNTTEDTLFDWELRPDVVSHVMCHVTYGCVGHVT